MTTRFDNMTTDYDSPGKVEVQGRSLLCRPERVRYSRIATMQPPTVTIAMS